MYQLHLYIQSPKPSVISSLSTCDIAGLLSTKRRIFIRTSTDTDPSIFADDFLSFASLTESILVHETIDKPFSVLGKKGKSLLSNIKSPLYVFFFWLFTKRYFFFKLIHM